MATGLRLMFGGDVMLGRLVREVMLRDGIHAPLAGVAPLLRSADLVLANLECALTDSAERWHGAPKAYYFAAPPEAGQALVDAGIRLVSLANNHSLDYDVRGLTDTLRILDAHGIAHAGAGPDLAPSDRKMSAVSTCCLRGQAGHLHRQVDRPHAILLGARTQVVAVGGGVRLRERPRLAPERARTLREVCATGDSRGQDGQRRGELDRSRNGRPGGELVRRAQRFGPARRCRR